MRWAPLCAEISEMDWQLIIALICVVFAAAVLVRRTYRWLITRRGGACGSGCGSCSSSAAGRSQPRQKPFVSLDVLNSPREQR